MRMYHPDRVLEADILVEMDDGQLHMFTAYRSQHTNVLGPYKGGIRFHEGVTKDEVKALSVWMSIKTATLGLPLGGGKGGVIVNPKELSEGELERLSRAYVGAFWRYLWPDMDVPAPDVNTNATIMAWMTDEYEKLNGKAALGTFTGKPTHLGGSLWRNTATAQGWFYVLNRFLQKNNDTIVGKKVSIQGIGNAGMNMAEMVVNAGAILVGVSDSKGMIYNPNGLDLTEIKRLKHDKEMWDKYRAWDVAGNDDGRALLLQETDILIPAALENQITAENVHQVSAKIILELANGPITPDADEVLFNRNIPVIPDILANAWGVTVSYFEQVQNTQNFFWSRQEVEEKLKIKMELALDTVYEKSQTHGIALRTGAYIGALERIYAAMDARGML